jgi:hypothetical protein
VRMNEITEELLIKVEEDDDNLLLNTYEKNASVTPAKTVVQLVLCTAR